MSLISIYNDMRQYLADDATVQQVTPVVRLTYGEQEDEKPFIVVVPRSEERAAAHSQGSGTKYRVTIGIHCHATTFQEVLEMREAVRNRLDAYRGDMGESFINACTLQGVEFDNPDPRQAQSSGEHVALMTFVVNTDEAQSEVRDG